MKEKKEYVVKLEVDSEKVLKNLLYRENRRTNTYTVYDTQGRFARSVVCSYFQVESGVICFYNNVYGGAELQGCVPADSHVVFKECETSTDETPVK